MKLTSHMKAAFYNLMYSRLRSILAMLGILVGTASVVALVSSGQLATQQALDQFKQLGTDLLSLTFYIDASQSISGEKPQEIDVSTLINMKKMVAGINEIAPYMTTSLPIDFEGKIINGYIIGSTQALNDVMTIKLSLGRHITDLDADNLFCVVGKNIYYQIDEIDPVGKRIKLGSLIYTIIGVADVWPENNFFTQNINDSILVPISTVKMLSPNALLNNAIIRLNKDVDIDRVKESITSYFEEYASGYRIIFHSAKELIIRMSTQQKIFTLLLGLIGSVTLLVGGIGVMNIMLVSVTERRQEIGLRLALGAKPKDIQMMFLIEAIILASMGGMLGVIIGILSSYLIAKIAGWHFALFILPPIIGFVVCLMVSVFFGFYPAYQASKLNPIDALRTS